MIPAATAAAAAAAADAAKAADGVSEDLLCSVCRVLRESLVCYACLSLPVGRAGAYTCPLSAQLEPLLSLTE
jgi:hypothetical protein